MKEFNFTMMVFCLLTIVGCSVEDTLAESAVAIHVDPEQLQEGRVVIIASIENTGSSPLTFLTWGTPFETTVSGPFIVVQVQALNELHSVSYKGILIKRAPPQEKDYLTLNPGQTLSNRLDITESYTFCRGLNYMMAYEGPLFPPDQLQLSTLRMMLEFSTGDSFPSCDPIE